jgi:hypothetical protein
MNRDFKTSLAALKPALDRRGGRKEELPHALNHLGLRLENLLEFEGAAAEELAKP